MLDFMCMGGAGLFGTGRERKIQNENIIMFPVGFEPKPRHKSISAVERSITLVRYQV